MKTKNLFLLVTVLVLIASPFSQAADAKTPGTKDTLFAFNLTQNLLDSKAGAILASTSPTVTVDAPANQLFLPFVVSQSPILAANEIIEAYHTSLDETFTTTIITKPGDTPAISSPERIPPLPGLEVHPGHPDEPKTGAPQTGGSDPAATAGWTTIMQEGFEGAFPNGSWRAYDQDGATNGEYYWDDDDYIAYNGYWSAWAANGGANGLDPYYYYYPNNMKSWMIYGPFDLSNASDAEMLFYYWNQSEINYDWFSWYASPNGTNFYGYRVSGDSGGWKSVNFDLTSVPGYGSLLGDSSVWIAFSFNSDYSIVDDGPFVDNITLQKYVNTSNCSNQYKAEYFNNRYLSGSPAFTRCENWPISQNWGTGSPGSGVGSDNFSVRWTGQAYIAAGTYTFIAAADDGIRVWLDNNLIVDAWRDQGLTEYRVTMSVGSGNHAIKVEYYENSGGAAAQFRWVSGAVCPTITGWKGEYWNNQSLNGSIYVCRNEANLDLNWGTGAPISGIPGIPADHFSAQWTRASYFDAGSYGFYLAGDDGIRLFIDGQTIIDKWQDQGFTQYSAAKDLAAGSHNIQVRYYENTGNAAVRLNWAKNNSIVISNRPAFDACTLPNTSQMLAWWNSSPYREANIYIGGSNRGCNAWNQQYLTAQWVSTVRSQGWNFIPTWVGPQAPCSGFGSRISYDLNTAYNQGRSEADQAANAAKNLGLTVSGGLGGTIIYYDMESYSNNSSCRNAVKSFMSGWVSRLHELGNRAGGYGSACASYLNDWSSITGGNVPDDLWPAAWIYSSYNSGASVWGVSCIPDYNWAYHQRIRQYTGGHSEMWGGITLNIDSDISDGHVSGSNSRGITALATTGDQQSGSFSLEMQPEKLRSMQLISATQGWVLSGNRLLSTASAGQNWQDITPVMETGATLRSAHFVDAQHGWVITGGAPDTENFSVLQVGRTSDGGQTWEFAPLNFNPVDGNSTQSQAYLSFVDEHTGWIAIKLASSINFSYGALFGTQDGGQTWTELSLPIGEPVHFIDADTGWVAGGAQGNELYVTHDGGRTWQARNIPVERGKDSFYQLSQPGFIDQQNGLIAVTFLDAAFPYMAFYATQDGGETWTSVYTTEPAEETSALANPPVNLPGSRVWLIPDVGKGALYSFDPNTGSQHSIQPSIPLAGLQDMQFVTPQVGWALVNASLCSGDKAALDAGTDPGANTFQCETGTRLFMTSDGGQTWAEVAP